jgi:Fe-S-cluster containining protein
LADFEADYSEVKGKFVDCHPECGMCCLCQPEVLPEEMEFFEINHPYALVKARHPDDHVALALKKGRGSCIFLNNRKCDIYRNRPAFCRQYPFYIYVGEKVSVELDLSCRGAWDGKRTDAEKEAKGLVENARSRISSVLEDSKSIYEEFYHNCAAAGIMGDLTEIRSSVAVSLSKFTDPTQLSRILDISEYFEAVSVLDVKPDFKADFENLDEAARAAAMGSMSTEDPLSMPIYCDGEWNWNIFMADGDSIEWAVMDDEGEIHHKAFASSSKISLKPLEEGGRDVLAQYVSLLNRRESFAGSVFNNMDVFGYEDHMSNAYYGTLAVSVLDLLWRASMLDHFMGTGMGAEGIKEAIIFYDMDRLDAPSIGSFV